MKISFFWKPCYTHNKIEIILIEFIANTQHNESEINFRVFYKNMTTLRHIIFCQSNRVNNELSFCLQTVGESLDRLFITPHGILHKFVIQIKLIIPLLISTSTSRVQYFINTDYTGYTDVPQRQNKNPNTAAVLRYL